MPKSQKKNATKKKSATKKRTSSTPEVANTYNVKDIIELPISSIKLPSSFDIRTDDAPQKPLIDSIKERGQLTPVWVLATHNGEYELISGHRRIDALKALNRKTVVGRVFHNISYDDAFNLAITENVQRNNLTQLDKAMLCLHLQEKGRKRIEIATILFPHSKSKDKERTVQNYLLVAKTDPRIHDALSEGLIELSHAVLLAKCLKETDDKENVFLIAEQLDFIIDTVKKNDMSVRDCKELIDTCKADKITTNVNRKRKKSEPVVFREGRHGNWSLRINFNKVKCDNNLELADRIEDSLVVALKSIRQFKESKTLI